MLCLNDRTIFITGGTGFLGKVLIEKILRDYRGIKCMYLVIRAGKGMRGHDRMEEEIIKSPVFDTLKNQLGVKKFQELCKQKLIAVEGDVTLPLLGISNETLGELDAQGVDIVFHCAASINFNDPIAQSIQLNVVGAMEMLELGKRWQVKSYVHVSTAFVGARFRKREIIEERIYPLDFDIEKVMECFRRHHNDSFQMNKLQREIQGEFPNTYTLTKSIAEAIVAKNRGALPVAIVRPSIVGAAWREPFPGWVDVVSAASAVFMSIGLGALTLLHGNPRGVACIVPVDTTVNHMLLACGEVLDKYNLPSPIVSHCCSSTMNPCRWRVVSSSIVAALQKHDLSSVKFTPGPVKFRLLENRDQFNLEWLLRYSMPEWALRRYGEISGSSAVTKQAGQLQLLNDRAKQIVSLFEPFLTMEYFFDCSMIKRCNASPDPLLPVDIHNVFWPRYFETYIYGLERFVLHMDLIPIGEVSNTHTDVSLTHDRLIEWDPDHHSISFPGLIPDISWAFTSRRKPGYTNSGVFGRLLGWTGWQEGLAHEAQHVPRKVKRTKEDMWKLISKSKLVIDAINNHGDKVKARQLVRTHFQEIASTLVDDPPRMFGWALRKVWRTMFEGVKIHQEGLESLRRVTMTGTPVVLVPTHRSYVDFLMLSFVYFAFNLPVPFIAATTDFLSLHPSIVKLLRSSGAFFLKRQGSLKQDPLYAAVFASYFKQLLADGQTVEYYIEGTRSRSGKSLSPKSGLTQICIDAVRDGTTKDIVFVPVSVDYEKLVEASVYSHEMLGVAKPKENTWNLLKSGMSLRKAFGNVSVQFGSHVSLRELMNREPDVSARSLGMQMIVSMEKSSVCMPIHLVATLFMMYKHGISLDQLANSVEWLRDQILRRDGHVVCMEGEHRVELVKRAIHLLGDVVHLRESPRMYQVTVDSSAKKYGNYIILSHYRNKIVHLFATESILMCVVMRRSAASMSCTLRDMQADLTLLTSMLENEFVTLEWGIDWAAVAEKSPVFSISNGAIKLETSMEAQRIITLLGSIIWPLVDSMLVAVASLMALKEATVSLESLVQRMLLLGENWFHDRVIQNYEACSTGTLRSFIELLSRKGIIYMYDQAMPRLPGKSKQHTTMVHLADEYTDKLKLESFVKQIEVFRRPVRTTDPGHFSVANFPLLSKL